MDTKAKVKLLLYRRQLLLKLASNNEKEWVKKINKGRKDHGAFNNLIAEMRLHDIDSYFQYFRMTPASFDILLSLVGAEIKKKDTNYRQSISPAERLSLTLRYLASGDSLTSISFQYRVGISTVSTIINETCEALWTNLKPLYLQQPTQEKWKSHAEKFEKAVNFPNCVGAIDGKHVIMQAPHKSGSLYYNYKGTYSMILLAACDATYCYTFVDIGAFGKQGDSTVFKNTVFGTSILEGRLNLPTDKQISDSGMPMPFVFVADEAFPLKRHIMRPYPGKELTDSKRIFNYRLCRARRLIENTFGITANRWRILRRPIIASVDKVEKIIKAVVCLHNFICQNEVNSLVYQKHYLPSNLVDREDNGFLVPGKWRSENNTTGSWHDIQRISSNTYSQEAKTIRDEFEAHFVKNPLPWQQKVIERGQ